MSLKTLVDLLQRKWTSGSFCELVGFR